MTKDFLAGLLLHLESSSINKLGLNYETYIKHKKLAANTRKLETRTGHFTETSCGHSNYFFCYCQSNFI